MHQTASSVVSAPAARVAEIVGDLGTYSSWLDLVTDAVPADPTPSGDPVWLVTIRATVGPFARSKKLRMVRTAATNDGSDASFRFERQEIDGRSHSAWTLQAEVSGDGDQANVTMDLRYDGRLWTAPLEPILGSFIDGAGPDLEAYANRS